MAVELLELALSKQLTSQKVGEIPARGSQAIAIDGKAQRTRAKFKPPAAKGTPCDLLSLFCHQLGLVLAQVAIENKEAELSVAPLLLSQIEWLGRWVLTGDAMFCQRNFCTKVVEAGGDYFFAVKANQPPLEDDIKMLFEPVTQTEIERVGFEAPVPLQIEQANLVDKGHGHLEVRQLKVSSELADYADWPYLAQVIEIKRYWQSGGVEHLQIWHGVTSLPLEVADLRRLLALKRGHWGIENRLHWLRDVVFGEDKSTLHTGKGPHLLAILRNVALNVLRLAGYEHISEVLRANSCSTARAFSILGLELNA